MQKGKDEDEMLDQTLKAIEIASIADMLNERDNLEQSCTFLAQKKAELDKIEEILVNEKNKKENKARPGRRVDKNANSPPPLSPRSRAEASPMRGEISGSIIGNARK